MKKFKLNPMRMYPICVLFTNIAIRWGPVTKKYTSLDVVNKILESLVRSYALRHLFI